MGYGILIPASGNETCTLTLNALPCISLNAHLHFSFNRLKEQQVLKIREQEFHINHTSISVSLCSWLQGIKLLLENKAILQNIND